MNIYKKLDIIGSIAILLLLINIVVHAQTQTADGEKLSFISIVLAALLILMTYYENWNAHD